MARFNRNKLKYEFIRSPFELPLILLRRSTGYFSHLWSPELRGSLLEDSRIDTFPMRVLQRNTNGVDVGCHYGSSLSRFYTLPPEGRHLDIARTRIKASMRQLRVRSFWRLAIRGDI
jgi:hypothetical protein